MRALITARVRLRGLVARLTGGDRTGLTVPCRADCDDRSPHDAHLAPGAAAYLHAAGRRR